MEKTIEVYIDDNTTYIFPAKFEVCWNCEGKGKHINSNIECEGGGFTGSEWNEICLEDSEFADNYFGGMYDIACACCKGKGIILVIDESLLTAEDDIAYLKYQEAERERDYREAERESERRMGC